MTNSKKLISSDEAFEIFKTWERASALLLYETFRLDTRQRRDFFVRINFTSLGNIGIDVVTIDPPVLEFFVKLDKAEFFLEETDRWPCIVRAVFASGNEIVLSGEFVADTAMR
jgi:hypothetical protein